MTNAITCQNCHGNMSATGGDYVLRAGGSIDGTNDGGRRRPWMDLPRCQSCHTGDAVNHIAPQAPNLVAADGLRLLTAFDINDPAASPRKANNLSFAENTNSLYRFSRGHMGVNCEGCHGSTHAIWPNGNATANDNVISKQLQGHDGLIGECVACHKAGTVPLTLAGPHGMHPVNDPRWLNENAHPLAYEINANSCKACHGTDYRGYVLSKTFADRTINAGDYGVKHFPKGHMISCYDCHNGPGGGGLIQSAPGNGSTAAAFAVPAFLVLTASILVKSNSRLFS